MMMMLMLRRVPSLSGEGPHLFSYYYYLLDSFIHSFEALYSDGVVGWVGRMAMRIGWKEYGTVVF